MRAEIIILTQPGWYMNFDPAIAARQSLQCSEQNRELGPDLDAVLASEATFSESAGPEARAAYRTLLDIGARHPDAGAFHAFLIYITWQQAAEETIPEHFLTGTALCDRYLAARSQRDDRDTSQIRELRASFRAALGLDQDDDDHGYDADVFKGGD